MQAYVLQAKDGLFVSGIQSIPRSNGKRIGVCDAEYQIPCLFSAAEFPTLANIAEFAVIPVTLYNATTNERLNLK